MEGPEGKREPEDSAEWRLVDEQAREEFVRIGVSGWVYLLSNLVDTVNARSRPYQTSIAQQRSAKHAPDTKLGILPFLLRFCSGRRRDIRRYPSRRRRKAVFCQYIRRELMVYKCRCSGVGHRRCKARVWVWIASEASPLQQAIVHPARDQNYIGSVLVPCLHYQIALLGVS